MKSTRRERMPEHKAKMARKKERNLLPHRILRPIANLSRKHKNYGKHPREAYGS